MANLKANCINCSSEIVMNVNQSLIFNNKLAWNASFTCPHCRTQIEIDGGDDLPDEARNAILAEQGVWGLKITPKPVKTARVLKVLREALGLSIEAVSGYRNSIPGIVSTGTRAEMERLHLLLSAKNLDSSVERITDDATFSNK